MGGNRELPDPVDAVQTAVTRLPNAAPRRPRGTGRLGMAVDGHRAGPYLRGDSLRPGSVPAPHRRGQVEALVVDPPNGFVVVLHSHDRQQGAKRLFTENVHVLGAPFDDRRIGPQRSISVRLAGVRSARHQYGPLVDGIGYVPFESIELCRRRHRADVPPTVLSETSQPARKFVLELVRDRVRHVGTFDRRTGLPCVQEGTPQDARCREIEVRVVANKGRVLSAEFQHDRGQMFCSRLRYRSSGGRGTSEAQLVARSVDESRSHLACTLYDGCDSGRKRLEHLSEAFTHSRCHLRRFEHHRVPCEQRGNHTHQRQEERVVPRSDASDHTEWSVLDT